jgi:hypothetical protein
MEDCKHTWEDKKQHVEVEIEGKTMFIGYHRWIDFGGYEEEESSISIEVKFCPFCGKELDLSA